MQDDDPIEPEPPQTHSQPSSAASAIAKHPLSGTDAAMEHEPAAVTPEPEDNAMLDVHAPHETIHTWKDFFIHIATIAVGLLIAVGLEQTVEYIHHLHQIAQTREILRAERLENHTRAAAETQFWRRNTAMIRNNLTVLEYLKQHPKTPRQDLPGILSWGHGATGFTHTGWDAAKQSGIAAMMPSDEVARNAELYAHLQRITDAETQVIAAMGKAIQYGMVDPDPTHFSPQQLDREIQSTEDMLSADNLEGHWLYDLPISFHDFPPSIERQELDESPRADPATGRLLSRAAAITADRVKAAGPQPIFVDGEWVPVPAARAQ